MRDHTGELTPADEIPIAPDVDDPMPTSWSTNSAIEEMECCYEWGITRQQFLAQSVEDRAMMLAFLRQRSRKAAVDAQNSARRMEMIRQRNAR